MPQGDTASAATAPLFRRTRCSSTHATAHPTKISNTHAISSAPIAGRCPREWTPDLGVHSYDEMRTGGGVIKLTGVPRIQVPPFLEKSLQKVYDSLVYEYSQEYEHVKRSDRIRNMIVVDEVFVFFMWLTSDDRMPLQEYNNLVAQFSETETWTRVFDVVAFTSYSPQSVVYMLERCRNIYMRMSHAIQHVSRRVPEFDRIQVALGTAFEKKTRPYEESE